MGLFSRLFAPASHEPREREVLCAGSKGLHRMRYREWGDPANARVLVCVHGLTRNGRDFDALARAMSANFRVVCLTSSAVVAVTGWRTPPVTPCRSTYRT